MNLIYYFAIFSVFGWILEVVFRSVKNRRLVNPGFLMGFYLPIYGFGALVILAGHTILESYSLPIRALFYFVSLAGLELIAGVAIERIFHTRLWDYRDKRFNIRGHVCLLFAIYWTLLAAGLDLALDFLIPYALMLHERLYPVIDVVLALIALAMFFDFLASVRRRLRERGGRLVNEDAARQEFVEIARPLLLHPSIVKLKDCGHHFGKSRLDHVLDVAWRSFRISKGLSLDCEATVRGALLHDLFYYDWLREGPRRHSIRHPRIALKNAMKVTALSDKEQDIIKKHMWPLTVIPPRYPESWAVCLSDIYCSWRDYFVPIALFFVGKRKEWQSNECSSFPSYGALKNGFLSDEKAASRLPLPGLAGRSLNILLIDAQPHALPFIKFRTLTLPRVAGATPAKHNVRIIDGRVEKITIPADGIDLVGITFSTNNAPLAYRISRQARELGILTVAGGTHATAVPDEVLEHFDSVLIREAEGGAWDSLLKDAENGSLEKQYFNTIPPDLSNLGPPRLDLLRSRLYLPAYPVEATRGCPNRCSFCFNRYIHPTYRKRPVDQVVSDVKRADSRHIFFMDDNLTADPAYAKELFAALRPLKKRLWLQMHLNAAEDEELVRLAAEAGCKGIFTGLESINGASLDSVAKSFNRVEKYKELISVFDRYGIYVGGGLIFGLDGDRPDVFQQTLEFLDDTAICSVAANLVIPYPGTDFYTQMNAEGRLLDRNYNHYTAYSPIVRPEGMTVDELERGYENFTKEFYSAKSVLGRFRNQKRPLMELPLYVGFNVAYRVPRQMRARHWLSWATR